MCVTSYYVDHHCEHPNDFCIFPCKRRRGVADLSTGGNAPSNRGPTHSGQGSGTLRLSSIMWAPIDWASLQVIWTSGQAMSGLQPYPVVERSSSYDKHASILRSTASFSSSRKDSKSQSLGNMENLSQYFGGGGERIPFCTHALPSIQLRSSWSACMSSGRTNRFTKFCPSTSAQERVPCCLCSGSVTQTREQGT